MTTALLELENVACGYANRAVLSGVSFSINAGDFLCLVGPNGVGKSTLFKTILRLIPLRGGAIRIDGEDVAAWTIQRFATTVGYVPQAHSVPFPFAVLDVVAMGRAAHLGIFETPSTKDAAIAEEALETLSIGHLRRKSYSEISGGERQLALLARALVQRPKLLILDEPTSNLDYGNQIAVLDHIRDLTRKIGLGVIMTSHDPNNALSYASHVAALGRDGRVALGTPRAVITEDYLLRTYDIHSEIVTVRMSGSERHVCVPLGKSGNVVDMNRFDARVLNVHRSGACARR